MAKIDSQTGFFLVRAKGITELGNEWPSCGVMTARRERHALLYDDGERELIRGSLQDAMDQGMAQVNRGVKRIRIGTACGRFGEEAEAHAANIYELHTALSADDYKPVEKAAETKNHKTVHCRITKREKNGSVIQGLASTPSIDRDNDVVVPEAFGKSLEKFRENPQLLFNHNANMPVGLVDEVKVTDQGLFVKARVNDPQIREWVKSGQLRMFSVQFIIKDADFERKEIDDDEAMVVRVIKEAELLEVSVVTIPANRDASFQVVKAVQDGTDLFCTDCTQPADQCGCGGSRVVQYRRFPVAAREDGLRWNQQHMEQEVGRRSARLTACYQDDDGQLRLPHHTLQGDEVKTSPLGVRLAMASLLGRRDGAEDLDDEEHLACYHHLSKHWSECFEDEPAPEYQNRAVAPAALIKILTAHGGGFELIQASYSDAHFDTEQDARDTHEEMGLGSSAWDGYTATLKSGEPIDGTRRKFEPAKGIALTLARVQPRQKSDESPKEAKMPKMDAQVLADLHKISQAVESGEEVNLPKERIAAALDAAEKYEQREEESDKE